jgi:hypothetical protein
LAAALAHQNIKPSVPSQRGLARFRGQNIKTSLNTHWLLFPQKKCQLSDHFCLSFEIALTAKRGCLVQFNPHQQALATRP